ncbi:type III secretion system export apparatus subunit SctT [Azohydromonas caseinilytica]|uniref:Type III secretion system export apparatus subunit SctT n=1 Tax=Azohydromonas caseinilytica TaxID=2728836 RepID=A0A848F0Z1_9BURK|nr:type III secretion system export apparatus subunit SctT [Azohydromonas caseinilytica]NML13364.1 type III secretion system export apparatus subunit SctT [Azohydromonas caseinilytica]
MEALALFGSLSDTALLLGLSVTRVAVCFLLVPLFTAEVVPALVRNALFVAVALLGLVLQPSAAPVHMSASQWAALLAKEAFIGGAIGLLFAGVLWAFEIAGQLIDTKIGATQAQIADPLSGHQTTLNGAFFGRLAAWVFMSHGGFMLLVGALVESFNRWPVRQPLAGLALGGVRVFEGELGRIMLLALLVAAPALLLLYVIEGVLGLMNRFAQQLNVFSLAMSLKAVAATLIILAQLATLIQLLQDDLMARAGVVLEVVGRLVAGS